MTKFLLPNSHFGSVDFGNSPANLGYSAAVAGLLKNEIWDKKIKKNKYSFFSKSIDKNWKIDNFFNIPFLISKIKKGF